VVSTDKTRTKPTSSVSLGRVKLSGVVEFHRVTLAYPSTQTLALEEINLSIKKGEFVYLTGHSGAGKSSFLGLIIKKVVPSSGQVYIGGESLAKYKGGRVAHHRRRIGMVFQDHSLLDHLSVYQNLEFALRITEAPQKDWSDRITTILRTVGLAHKHKVFPIQLSQGERQRVAIARAVVTNPILLLADEPTGNLDPDVSWEIMELLSEINLKGTTIILATHSREIVEQQRRRTLTLRKGRLVRDDPNGGYAI
jgi:cell division transport system ATP-binding protein